MIAVDTSSWIAFLDGSAGDDTTLVARTLADRQVCIPPAVLTELLSDPRLPARVARLLGELPLLDVLDGFWARAGALRATVLARRRRAPLADALIAQSCLDHDVGLVTRDVDFEAFSRAGGLRVLA